MAAEDKLRAMNLLIQFELEKRDGDRSGRLALRQRSSRAFDSTSYQFQISPNGFKASLDLYDYW